MKEILALVRMNMMNETKNALSEAGVSSFTARKVMGRGKGKVDYHILKGAEAGYDEAINQLGPNPKFIPKRMIQVILPDDMVPVAVEAIIRVNQTGHPGDGKIFVLPVLESVRIRTGETGKEVLDEARPKVKA